MKSHDKVMACLRDDVSLMSHINHVQYLIKLVPIFFVSQYLYSPDIFPVLILENLFTCPHVPVFCFPIPMFSNSNFRVQQMSIGRFDSVSWGGGSGNSSSSSIMCKSCPEMLTSPYRLNRYSIVPNAYFTSLLVSKSPCSPGLMFCRKAPKSLYSSQVPSTPTVPHFHWRCLVKPSVGLWHLRNMVNNKLETLSL